MTVNEWREKNHDTSYTLVWAADAASFGRKGHSVYGSHEVTGRMEIVRIENTPLKYPEPHDFFKLHVWDSIVCTERP